MKINLIYNSEIRNTGTPIHFWHAFKELGINFERFLPRGVLPACDFSVWIDDGRDDIRWLPEGPWGYYATDSHLGHDYRKWKASKADIVWCAQKPFADELKDAGMNAHWVPLACNPVAHPTASELAARMGQPEPEVKYDVGFVGFLQKPEESNRIEFLDAVLKAYPNFLVGFGVFHEEMAHYYHQAKVGINHAIRNDLNMRFFELASVGVAQLCDRRMVGLGDLGFFDGVHYFGYYSTEEAIAKAKYMLAHPEDCRQVAQMAWHHVRERHTYKNRVERMMENIGDFLANPDRSAAAAQRA